MNQIVSNVEKLIAKYPPSSLNSDMKLSLLYWKEFERLRMDSKYVSTADLIKMNIRVEDIVNARYILGLLKEKH